MIALVTQLGDFFSKYISFSSYSLKMKYFCVKLVQHNAYLLSIVDTNGEDKFNTRPKQPCLPTPYNIYICSYFNWFFIDT